MTHQYLSKPAFHSIREIMTDDEITEVMINGWRNVFVERSGQMMEIASPFHGQQQLVALVEAMLHGANRTATFLQPWSDLRLPDGSRVNVVVKPVAADGPVVTIRKFTDTVKTLADLIARGTLDDRVSYFLVAAIRSRLNMVLTGGTGTGKTTLAAILSEYIAKDDRIVVIEDTMELEFRQRNVVRLECRPANVEGTGEINQAQLLKNSLRMRPNRIILGEVRGDEAIEMLQAMTTGHDGCIGILHAGSPTHTIARLEMMVTSRGLGLPLWAVHAQVANALDVIVQLHQEDDGTRRVTHITAVELGEDGKVALHDIFRFIPARSPASAGRFVSTGYVPVFAPRFERLGIDAATLHSLFAPTDFEESTEPGSFNV